MVASGAATEPLLIAEQVDPCFVEVGSLGGDLTAGSGPLGGAGSAIVNRSDRWSFLPDPRECRCASSPSGIRGDERERFRSHRVEPYENIRGQWPFFGGDSACASKRSAGAACCARPAPAAHSVAVQFVSMFLTAPCLGPTGRLRDEHELSAWASGLAELRGLVDLPKRVGAGDRYDQDAFAGQAGELA